MGKNYELLPSDTIKWKGRTLYRVRALREIRAHNPYERTFSVKPGELGGYIRSELNLAQFGSCWIFPGAVACDCARISGHARIFGPAEACHGAKISDYATIYGNTRASGNSRIYGSATIGQLCDNVPDENIILICDNARIHGNVSIMRDQDSDLTMTIGGDVDLSGNIELCGVSLSGSITLKTPLTCPGSIFV